MLSKNTEHTQCIIAQYQKELQIDDDKNDYIHPLYLLLTLTENCAIIGVKKRMITQGLFLFRPE